MKLASFCTAEGPAAIGVVQGNDIVSLAGAIEVPRTMIELIAAGPDVFKHMERAVLNAERVPLNSVRLLAPILRPPEFLGVGLNYRDHALEANMPLPSVPLVFNKQTSSVTGPFDGIYMPRVSDQLDYEVELGIVTGRAGRYLSQEAARAAIFGYTVVNDVSVRDWQLRSPTFTLGKSFDTHGPYGPWIVTADEIPDVQNLQLVTRVNGEVRQQGTTAQMIFDCVEIVRYLSQVMTLAPGTLITTGTPAGVAFGKKPPPWLRIGDEVSVEIEGIGKMVNRVIEEPRWN